ncbi:MAG TPA: hypothetical protein DCE78_02360 [Bacteroidetes bacterium]|nr:hypothetical protein [Bacteroidota bacterium]
MNKQDIRAHYESELNAIKEANTLESWSKNNLDGLWKTQHSLQLSRFGFLILKKYCKVNDVSMLSVSLTNGRSIGELLMLANTMNVPYYLTESYTTSKLLIHTIESDRSTMLIMGDGNIINWANMYRND